jgi:uncharacterized protein YjiS (DUF1127 family)
MSNRLNAAGMLPLIIDPLQAVKVGQAINTSQRQVAQTIALGQTYMSPFRVIADLVSSISRSIDDALEMRDLYELHDRQLADIGIQCRQLAVRSAQRRHDERLRRDDIENANNSRWTY